MKKLTVTVGIPAYNEEANIRHLVNAILRQKCTYYELDKVIVISDGSSDRTLEILRNCKNRKLQVIDGDIRKGQNYRINQIIHLSKSKIIVLAEADTLPVDDRVLDALLKPFLVDHNKDIGMVYGRWKIKKASNFYEKIVSTTSDIKLKIFKKWKNGVNVYFSGGHSIKALYKKVAINVRLPIDVPEDVFFYLKIKKLKKQMIYIETATMLYRNVSNIQDRLSQLKKFKTGINSLKKYFSVQYVNNEYKIPFSIILPTYITEFLRNPVMVILSLIDIILTRLFPVGMKELFKPKYRIYESTKVLIE